MSELKKKRRKQRNRQIKLLAMVGISGIVLIVALGLLVATLFGSSNNTGLAGNENNGSLTEDQGDIDADNTEDIETNVEDTVPGVTDYTMFFTGDVMLQNSLGTYDSKGISGILSEYLQEEMKAADLTMINNEFPFSTRGEQAPDKQFTFRVNPSYVSILQDMGVDVASLANNHALDFGKEALSDSIVTIKEAGIAQVGAGETKEEAEAAAFIESGGRTVGVLSASRVIPVGSWNIDNSKPGLFCTYSSTRMVERIQEIEDECDFVVVFVHWGIERNPLPEEYQRNLAKDYIDAGADLVVGNHAHVPQGIEYYKGVPIVYCMGNYIFNPNMVDTYTTKAVWSSDGNLKLQVIPVSTSNYHTYELEGEDKTAFYDYLESISFDIEIDEDGYVYMKKPTIE